MPITRASLLGMSSWGVLVQERLLVREWLRCRLTIAQVMSVGGDQLR